MFIPESMLLKIRHKNYLKQFTVKNISNKFKNRNKVKRRKQVK